MRVVGQAAFRVRDADLVQEFGGAVRGGTRAHPEVDPQALADLRADGVHRIQRGHRFLEDHRGDASPHAPHHALGRADQFIRIAIASHQACGTRDSAVRRGRREAEQAEAGHALAGTGFAHQRQGLAAAYREADVAHGMHRSGCSAEGNVQVAYIQDVLCLRAGLGGRGADGFVKIHVHPLNDPVWRPAHRAGRHQ